MIFNSLSFVLICLIPCVLLTVLADKFIKYGRISIENVILLAFSMLFYLWSGVYFIKFLFSIIVFNYAAGWLLQLSR